MNAQVRTIPFAFSQSGTLDRLLHCDNRITVLRGGTRSGKTYATLQMFARWLITGELRNGEYIKKGVAGIVRKYATTLKSTVLRDFKEIIFAAQEAMGCRFEILENKTNRTFKFGSRMVEFIGADDEQKLRGYKSNILYANEANELNYNKEFFQLMVRCDGPILLDFNPSDPYVWIKRELEDKRANDKGDVDTIVTTYLDNPWLSKTQVEEIENLEHTNPPLWRVYGLGEYGVTEGLVIPSITLIEELPTGLKNIGGGMDFGFTNDPTSLYWCGEKRTIEEVDGKQVVFNDLYVDQLIYETGLNSADLIKRFQDIGISKNFGIIADSSHPSTINTLRRAGYNVRKAIKKPGSVRSGISLLQSYRIFATKRSSGIIKEQQQYKFKQHANGNWLNDPVDAHNHAIDSLRYYQTRYARLKTIK